MEGEPIAADKLIAEMGGEVEKAFRRSSGARLRRLAKAPKLPTQVRTHTLAFVRNPDVVAEVLFRAGGRCEECHMEAPFRRASDGSPYLEVHHTIQLAHGGDDTVENAAALCPNCHRRLHYGDS